MPTKLRYKMMVAFCLMSILPLLVGVYLVSLFVPYPFEGASVPLAGISMIILFSLSLSFLGWYITRQIMMAIPDMSNVARHIAQGNLDYDPPLISGASDEIQELSQSLTAITKNAKQMLDKVEKLSLKDKLTGLYNAHYIRERLNEEIERAIHYQQACSFAYLMIHNYDVYLSNNGERATEEALKRVAHLISANLREFDRAARIGRGEFAIIFPDMNKKKCIEVMEKIGREILEKQQFLPCVGISENPIDGVQAEALFFKAQDRLKSAKQNENLLEAFV